jgi:SLT domain-containing protein
MSYISPIAGQAGWYLENVSAAIGLLGDKGVLGSKAGTGLREMFTRLIKPTKDASKEMQALGFQAIDPTTHKMKDIGTLVGDLQKSLGGLNSAQKENALATIFGQQALTPVSALLQTSKQAIDNETNSLKNSDGAAYNMAITMNDTLGKAFEKFKINIQNAFITNIDRTELGYSLKEFVVSMNKNMPAISSEIGKLLDTAVHVGSGIKQNWDGISSIVLGVASSFLVLKGAMKIDAAITALGGLKKALPTVEMAGGIGLVATGFSEIHDGNKGLGDLLIATGVGLTAASKGVKALDSTSIGLIAYAFIEMNQGNTGLGALLLATGAGLEALNKHLNRSATIILLGTAFGEIKEGNRGLGALLIGTAVGFAAIEVVTAPVALAIGLVASAIAYVVIECQTVKGAWANTWLSIKEATMEFVNPIIDKINGLITALDKLPFVNIDKISKMDFNSNDKQMAKSLGISDASIKQMGQMAGAGGGNALQSFKITSGTQALTNMVTPTTNVLSLLPKTKYASGTDNSIGGTALVGEKGPEIVNLPQGSQVINAQQTTKALGSNNKSMGSGVASSQNSLNSSTKKLLAENKAIVMDYVNKQTLYGQNSVKNFSTAVLEKEPLATVATTKVSTDNKNIMSLMANSGLTYGTEMVTELGQGVKDSEGNLITIVNDLATKVVNQFKTTFGIASPSKVMYQIGDFLGQGLINGMQANDINSFITKWIGDTSSLTQNGLGSVIGQLLQPMFAKGDNKGIISTVYNLVHNGLGSLFGGGGAVSGDLSQWITAAMALTGVGPEWYTPLASIIEHESGGDPNSINLYDINAIEGHPSKGLMQLIDENMQDYHLPGLTDIYNPVANIAAGIKYIEARYGSVFNVPGIRSMSSGGSYVGYVGGTNNATPGIHLVGEKGPELVWMKGGEHVTPNSELSSIRQQPYAGGSTSIKSETNPNISINIYESKDPRATAQEVYKVLRQHFGDLFDDKMATIKLQMGLNS